MMLVKSNFSFVAMGAPLFCSFSCQGNSTYPHDEQFICTKYKKTVGRKGLKGREAAAPAAEPP
ncbi:MAG: hypothetical protein LBQ57_12505, partial [Spirochaetales bacterium]|nr:hypothetical protein [Spirochaetales bacterium]